MRSWKIKIKIKIKIKKIQFFVLRTHFEKKKHKIHYISLSTASSHFPDFRVFFGNLYGFSIQKMKN